MEYSKFYTPKEIAEVLINELTIPEPDKVIDICCGSCNLLFAAKKRWTNAELYGTDVSIQSSTKDVKFDKIDGRKFAIEHAHEYSLVLANPPFDYVERKKQIPNLFVDEFKGIVTSRLEIEMLIANLRLLKPDGVLLVILPSSFVEAQTYKKVRKIIANHYCIESIIKLDENTFGNSKIHTYALIIRNVIRNEYNSKIGKSIGNNIIYNSIINSYKLKEGDWNNYDLNKNKITINLKRGNISSSYFSKQGQPILHTAKNSDNWLPSKRYISNELVPSVWAESGDIIVSRIGKSAGQWCIYDGEKMPISDCLYCIKSPNSIMLEKIKGKRYNLELKGVATRYITISDFCYWINSILD